MPLLEILVSCVGPAVAKTVLKLWAGDNDAAVEAGGSAIDVLAKLIPDLRARNEAERQLQAIGEEAAESLKFTFETEGRQLMFDDQEAVAKLVAQTLDRSKISAELLLERDLDPVKLTNHFVAEANEQLSLLPEPRAWLFKRVIEEASQSIVDIAGELPHFSERTFAELLRRDRVLIDAAHRTLESLDRIRAKVEDSEEAESANFETEYRRAVMRNLNRLELFGVDLSRASKSHPLSVAYVSLNVSDSTRDFDAKAKEIGGEEETESDDSAVQAVESALAGSRRLMVRGPAGAGKTTLFQWIAVRAASKDFEQPLEDWNDALPFLIRLRQVGDSDFPRPEDFPSFVAPAIAGAMPQGWVHQRLHSGRAVIMIDGVDEVIDSRRDAVRRWVKELVGTFPNCRFIVTSRPHAVGQNWLEDEAFADADLQPMDTEEIETFIDHWHRAVVGEAQREEEVGALEHLASNLKMTLRGNRAIRRLATNPLLCGVICALHRDTNEQLPEDRLDLYERCCSMLLERRDPESGLHIGGYPRLNYRQKRSLLDDLAYWMLKNGWTEIALASARDRFDKKIATFRPDGRDGVALTGESASRFFLERSGILREPLEGKLDFAHRTFQEFMSANAAVAEGDIGLLLSNATNPQWREVVILGAGLARPSERKDLIQSLLSEGDAHRDSRPQLHLLAAACLDAAVDVDSSLRSEVESRLANLFPPKSMLEAMEIAEAAGEMAIPFLRHSRFLTARQSSACIRALAMVGSLDAVQAIAEYANGSDLVLKEVVRASDRVDPDMFLEWIAPRLDPTRLPGDAVSHMIARFGFDIGQIINLEHARELSLSGGRARDLAVLQRLSHLRSLTLAGPAVADLSPLRSLPELRVLTLSRVSVNDLSPLRSLSALSSLWIRYSDVDAGQIYGMTELKSLSIWEGKISNQEALRSLSGLQSLSLFDSDMNLAVLADTELDRLSLGGFEGDISSIGGLRGLKHLYLSRVRISDVHWLSKLTNLETLDLYNVEISGSFPILPNLQKLGLKGSRISPELVNALRGEYPRAKIVT